MYTEQGNTASGRGQIPRGQVVNGDGVKIEPPDWTMDVIESITKFVHVHFLNHHIFMFLSLISGDNGPTTLPTGTDIHQHPKDTRRPLDPSKKLFAFNVTHNNSSQLKLSKYDFNSSH